MSEKKDVEAFAAKAIDFERLDAELLLLGPAGKLLEGELLRRCRTRQAWLEKNLLQCIDGRTTENLMDLLLELMGIVFRLDKNYRRNIENFNAVYVFTDQTGDFYAAAVFKDNKMTVTGKKIADPTFKLIFRDNAALIKLLFSGSPDILNAMLNQEVEFEGNINYMSKFGYMALHLVLGLTGGIVFA